jgi:glycosyltransferase involved in cell wall biosynthesis
MEFNGQRFPRFGDSKAEEVGSLMRRVLDKPEEAKIKNENMKKLIAEKYNWDKCTDLVEKYIEGIE